MLSEIKKRQIEFIGRGPGDYCRYSVRGVEFTVSRTEDGLVAVSGEQRYTWPTGDIVEFLIFLHDGKAENPFEQRRNPYND